MEEYPSNSKNAKSDPEKTVSEKTVPEKKKIEQVVVGSVTRRRKPLGKRFAETFGGGDAQSVGSYILVDVLLPAAKDMVADAVSQGIEKMLFGEARGRTRSPINRGGNSSYTSYNRYSNGGRPSDPRDRQDPRDRRPQMSQRAKAMHDFDEIVLESRAEADMVLDRLYSILESYDVVTVNDLYDLIGQTGSFTDDRWGWSNLQGSSIRRTRNGYLLDLPAPEPI